MRTTRPRIELAFMLCKSFSKLMHLSYLRIRAAGVCRPGSAFVSDGWSATGDGPR